MEAGNKEKIAILNLNILIKECEANAEYLLGIFKLTQEDKYFFDYTYWVRRSRRYKNALKRHLNKLKSTE